MLSALLSMPWALKLGRWALIGLSVLSALLYMTKRAEKAGAAAERMKANERITKQALERNRVDVGLRGASDADLDRWLRPPGHRDR